MSSLCPPYATGRRPGDAHPLELLQGLDDLLAGLAAPQGRAQGSGGAGRRQEVRFQGARDALEEGLEQLALELGPQLGDPLGPLRRRELGEGVAREGRYTDNLVGQGSVSGLRESLAPEEVGPHDNDPGSCSR